MGTGSESHRFALFVFLWTAALLSHQFHFRDTFRSFFDVALAGAALFSLVNPYLAWRFLAATGFHVLAVVHHAPGVFNHWLFAGLNSFAFVLLAVAFLVRGRRLDAADLSVPFLAIARLNLICLYYFSAFHKLNSDYFDLTVSCGGKTYGQLLRRLPFLPASDDALFVATYLGVGMELLLPTLLLSRRLRRLGVVLGLFFHLCLGLMGYSRFSVIAFALLMLFLPELGTGTKTVTSALGGNSALQSTLVWLRARRLPLIVLSCAVGFVLLNTIGRLGWLANRVANIAGLLTHLFFLAASAVLIAVSFGLLIRHKFESSPSSGFLLAAGPGWIATALLVLPGFAPYLGLHTLNTFAMYSNLRTENGITNHLIVPGGWQPFSYQRDVVEVVETNIPSLERLAPSGMQIPYQQLRSEITRAVRWGRQGLRVVFLRNGQTIAVTNAESHPQLGIAVNTFAFKFVSFRAVERTGPRACTY